MSILWKKKTLFNFRTSLILIYVISANICSTFRVDLLEFDLQKKPQLIHFELGRESKDQQFHGDFEDKKDIHNIFFCDLWNIYGIYRNPNVFRKIHSTINSRIVESNSSIYYSSIIFKGNERKHLLSINADSWCFLHNVLISDLKERDHSPFLCFGSLNLYNASQLSSTQSVCRSLSETSISASICISQSILTNLIFCGGGSVLHCGACSSEKLDCCLFNNITQENALEDEKPGLCALRSTFDNCVTSCTTNVLEGGIICGTVLTAAISTSPFTSLLSSNSSFLMNTRVDNSLTRRYQLSTTRSQYFNLCEWVGCTAECGGALYVHDNQEATLTVLNSSFSNCKATKTKGGGIFGFNISEVAVNNSQFEKCTSAALQDDGGGGGVSCNYISTQVISSNCLFEDGWSGNDAGGISILYCTFSKQEIGIMGCFFRNCSGNDETSSAGGGCDVLDAEPKMCCHSCCFVNCYSQGGAGGVMIRRFLPEVTIFYYCFFHNNTAQLGGHDIVIHDATQNQIDATCLSTRTTTNKVSISYKTIKDKSSWLRTGGRERYVSNSQNVERAKDSYFCGFDKTYPCLTISHCISQMIVGFVEEIRVLTGTVVEEKGVDVGEKTITVNGVSSSGSTIRTKFEANGLKLFCVGRGELAANNLSVVHNTSIENNRRSKLFEVRGSGLMNLKRLNISMDATHSKKRSIQNSLVKVDGGELKMKDVRWGQTFSITSLISLPQETTVSLLFNNSVFTNIVRTTAGPSLMNASEGSHSITLKGCTFDGCGSELSNFGGSMMFGIGSGSSLTMNGGYIRNCNASITQGRGGGIGLKVKDTSTEFLISSAFEGNRAKWGSDIFVDSIDLKSTAKSGKITSLTASFDTKSKIQGYDNGNTSFPIPLCVYLIPLPEEIIASNVDAFDYFYCGFSEVPCLTLRHSLTRQEKEKKIVVDGMIEIQYELSFDSFKHTIRGKDTNSGWLVIDNSDGSEGSLITISGNTVLKSLVFSVPSALQNHKAFFYSSSQLFSLKDCSLAFQNSQSALSYVFLSATTGKVSVSSLNVLSLFIGNCPLIFLDGSNAAGTFTFMNVEDISTATNSILFEAENGASLTIKDSTLSAKAYSQTDLPSESIRVISTNSVKMLKLTNNTMGGFRRIEGNGGAVECTLGRDCSLEIVGGMISGCRSKGGNGGGLWAEMKEGSTFTLGNMTNTDSARTIFSNDESGLLQFTSCKATQNTDGEHGYGGGIYLHLEDGASSFILKKASFAGCDAREGKEIFINANELSSVISRRSIGFEVDMSDLTRLNGFERSTLNETFAIPLVVYLWDNFSGSAFVGGSSSHDFSMCGYELFPCSTIAKAVSNHFEEKKKDITILESFAFEEEFNFPTYEWIIKTNKNEMKCDVSDQKEGTQSGLIENSVSVSVSGIVFSLKKSLTFHESVFECCSGKLTLNGCGMEGGAETISTVFVKAVGGIVEVNEFGSKNIKKGDSSFFIVVEGNGESVPSMNMTNSHFGEISFGDGSVVECHGGIIEEMSECTFSSITRSKGSGGCVGFSNENDNDGRDYKVEINNCTFEGCAVVGEENEIGGGAFFYEASANTNLLMSKCEFYGCAAPYEKESVGYGGGIMLQLLKEKEEAFVISSPVFSSDKPNNAKFGKDLFISSPSLIKSIKNETLPFVKDRLEALTEDSMRGYDGENRECAIPLVYFWKSIGSSVHVAEEGNDVVVCGLYEFPCESVDYGLNRGSNITLESMMFHGVCNARSVTEMNGLKLEGTNMESDKIRFAQALEGDGDVVVECKGAVQFSELGILIPSDFENGANILIQTGSDAVKTSVIGCSIYTNENVKDEVSFVLISASKGIVSIEKTEIAGFSTMHEIMSISADCVTTMNNVTFEDISLSGKSAIAMSESVISGREDDDMGEAWNFLFEQCRFMNVKHNVANTPSLLCCNVQNEMRLKMENSIIDGCGSTSSNEGGSIFFLLNKGGRLEMNCTKIAGCFSTNVGRGGGMFLKSLSTAQKALPFVLSNITFKWNVALKGRDVFVKCTNLETQISEQQFLIDFGEPFVKELAIWGCTADNYGDEEDLLQKMLVFRSEFIFVSSIAGNSSDNKNCGEMTSPCSSLNVGVGHIIPSDYSQLLIWNETTLTGSCSAQKVTIKSMEANRNAEIKVNEINLADEGAVTTLESVRLEKVSFVFDEMENIVCSCLIHQLNGSLILESVSFQSESRSMENSQTLFDFSLIVVEEGLFEAEKCSVGHLKFSKPVFQILHSKKATFEDVGVDDVECKSSLIECGKSEKVSISKLAATSIWLEEESLIFDYGHSSLVLSLTLSSFTNISRSSDGSCIVCTSHPMSGFEMCNCSFHECSSESSKGSQVSITSAEKILMESCVFEGNLVSGAEENEISDEVCKWNGSVVDFSKSSVMMKDTTICNSSKGGMTVNGGTMNIKDGRFENNNPLIAKYPSLCRNIICSVSASLMISSLKGGDGVKDNSSMWILNDKCLFEGIISERASSFFIPELESVEAKEVEEEVEIAFKGKLLLPCNLSFMAMKQIGEEKQIEKFVFDESGFASETEAKGRVQKETISEAGEEAEVRVCILFGNADAPLSTQSFILKNRSEPKRKEDEKISEKVNKIEWSLIAFICCVIAVAILLFVIILIVGLKQKKHNRNGREIEDRDIDIIKNVKITECRKEDFVQRVEEEELRTLLMEESRNEMDAITEKVKEFQLCENKVIAENTFDCEEVMRMVPVNCVEMQTVASFQVCEENKCIKTDVSGNENWVQEMGRKAKKLKRKKGKKPKQTEEIDKSGDVMEETIVGLERFNKLEELSSDTVDNGRNERPIEYYIGLSSAPNSHFSIYGDNSEEKSADKLLEEKIKVLKEDLKNEDGEEEERAIMEIGEVIEARGKIKEIEGEELMKECEGFEGEVKLMDIDGCRDQKENSNGEMVKQKRRKKKKKKNRKREEKSEFAQNVIEMGLLDAG
ncbi:uncharacterized protein MONOS_2568 [Monocercomonoides exilis]|uniref:uncharacterized protein n=1 Tax=Monocercomonoides exilis TaxID=2049356 RepID=UPI003559DA25|nr:hypothetical protein MONOS_2568 [Monocercomonoides exilis]